MTELSTLYFSSLPVTAAGGAMINVGISTFAASPFLSTALIVAGTAICFFSSLTTWAFSVDSDNPRKYVIVSLLWGLAGFGLYGAVSTIASHIIRQVGIGIAAGMIFGGVISFLPQLPYVTRETMENINSGLALTSSGAFLLDRIFR